MPGSAVRGDATIATRPRPASNPSVGLEGTLDFLTSARCARVWLVPASILLSLGLWNSASAAQLPSQQLSTEQSLAPASVARKRPVKAAKKNAVPDPPPPAPAPPPPPPTLEQMPASPPQVQYSRGQLTIVAENSTLADILGAVRTQTGALVDVPPSATERVVAHLGPGPTRDVLTALLNGTHFNYVMIGSPAHPDHVDRLILTSKSGGDIANPPPAPEAQNNNPVQTDETDLRVWISPNSRSMIQLITPPARPHSRSRMGSK